MTLDRQDAASSLTAIEHAEQRTGQAIIYGAASSFLILWGILTAIGYTFTEFYPYQPKIAWSVLMALGFAATAVMTMRNRGRLAGTHRQLGWQLVLAQIALIGFGLVTIMILGPVTGRQLDAFWPLLFMLGYVLAGIWVGQFFILCGLAIAVLTITGFWWVGAWFHLWMAVVNGGALIIGGLWLRRQGALV